MTPEDIKIMQEKIVRLCHAAGRFGVPEERILRTLQVSGYAIDAAELDRQLRYLASLEYITAQEDLLRPDLRRWETTAAGDQFLMKQGLI